VLTNGWTSKLKDRTAGGTDSELLQLLNPCGVPSRGPLLIATHGRLRAHPSTLAPPDVTRSPQAAVTPPAPQRQLRAKRTCGPARLRNRVANASMLLYAKLIVSLYLRSLTSFHIRDSRLFFSCVQLFQSEV
jgi:hypothetical protein